MQTLKLIVENKTADKSISIFLFGTADYLKQKMTLDEGDVEIKSCTENKTLAEIIELWDAMGIVSKYEVKCLNHETIISGKDYSHTIISEDRNGNFAARVLNNSSRSSPEFSFPVTYMTDTATRLSFLLSPKMKLQISMDFKPHKL